MRTFFQRCLLFCVIFAFAAGVAAQVAEPQIGYASFYSDRFQGKKTASGDTYDGSKLTASHKTLPFGTIVLVTNLSNNKRVKVKINDRGPFVNGRITDLSLAAAQQIGLVAAGGKVQVKLEVVGSSTTYIPNRDIYLNKAPNARPESAPIVADVSTKPITRNDVPASYNQPSRVAKPKTATTAPTKNLTPKGVAIFGANYPYAVQVASMSSKENALAMKRSLEAKNLLVWMQGPLPKDTINTYKVLLGPFTNRKAAQTYLAQAKKKHKVSGFVVTAASQK